MVVLAVEVARVIPQHQQVGRLPQLLVQYKVMLVVQENKELAFGLAEVVVAQVRLVLLVVVRQMAALVQPLLLLVHL
jgi:hypothetical protein